MRIFYPFFNRRNPRSELRSPTSRPLKYAHIRHSVCLTWVALLLAPHVAPAFTVYDLTSKGSGIVRWDAAPRMINGEERSLDGGLRYSIEGGSYAALRDALTWSGEPPSDEDFQAAVERSFRIWEAMDPATGLGTKIRFVPNFETEAIRAPDPVPPVVDGFQPNPGSEIDILARPFASNVGGYGFAYVDGNGTSITLTSGVSDYPGLVISGVDVLLNSNYGWDLDKFQIVFGHELGHALGLGDVNLSVLQAESQDLSLFYDDNFDDTTTSTARDTLTNSFAALIDPFDPDHSPSLGLYDVCQVVNTTNPLKCSGPRGIDAPGVNIFMESGGRSTHSDNLQNDDYAGRQFLYPWISVRGDFDADAQVTTADIDLLSAEIRSNEPRLWFDLDGNEVIDANDRSEWVHHVANTFYGDADLDGDFNTTDLVLIMTHGKYDVDVEATWSEGDFDGSGRFDSGDLVVAFMDGAFEQPRAQAVPEPSAGLGFALASLLTFTVRRRKLGSDA